MKEYAVEVTSEKEKKSYALSGHSKLAVATIALKLIEKQKAEKIRVVHASSWSETIYKQCSLKDNAFVFKEKY